MPAPMSNDLRKRIIEAKVRGATNKKIAEEKEVSESAVERLPALRSTGSYESHDVFAALQSRPESH